MSTKNVGSAIYLKTYAKFIVPKLRVGSGFPRGRQCVKNKVPHSQIDLIAGRNPKWLLIIFAGKTM